MQAWTPLGAAFGLLRLLAILLLGALSMAGPASAHAGLVATEPAEGATLASAPELFALTFSEPVTPLRLTLIAPDGEARALTGATVAGNRLQVEAPASLGRGTYALSWRVVSADGHPVAGTFTMSIGAPSAAPPPIPPSFDGSVQALVWAARTSLYLGLIFGIGGAASAFLVAPLPQRLLRPLRFGLLLGLLAVPLSLGAQGLDALGAPLSALTTDVVWQAAFDTGFGQAAGIAALALCAAFVSLLLRRGLARTALAGLALLAAGLALASTGHAANATPRAWTRPLVALHLISVALWIGALLPLAFALRASTPQDRTQTLRRFSRRVTPVVAILLATGLLLAVIQVGTLPALWQSSYGLVLLAKLVLVLSLFALAADNRWRLTRPAIGGDAPSLRSLRRHVALESVIALAVLGTVALWRFTPPPRIEAAIAAEPVQAHATGGRLMADLRFAPARVGPVTARAMLMTIDYGPVNPRSVLFTFRQPGGAGQTVRQEAHNPGNGSWRAEVVLPQSGTWHVRIDVATDDRSLDRLETDLYVRP